MIDCFCLAPNFNDITTAKAIDLWFYFNKTIITPDNQAMPKLEVTSGINPSFLPNRYLGQLHATMQHGDACYIATSH